jgi:hypothetical protein
MKSLAWNALEVVWELLMWVWTIIESILFLVPNLIWGGRWVGYVMDEEGVLNFGPDGFRPLAITDSYLLSVSARIAAIQLRRDLRKDHEPDWGLHLYVTTMRE